MDQKASSLAFHGIWTFTYLLGTNFLHDAASEQQRDYMEGNKTWMIRWLSTETWACTVLKTLEQGRVYTGQKT